MRKGLGVVAHACDPRSQEAVAAEPSTKRGLNGAKVEDRGHVAEPGIS